MGYFSQLAAGQMDYYGRRSAYEEIDDRRDYLEYRLLLMQEKLAALDAVRPRDPLHPDYDRWFYAQSQNHYYDDPQTVQELRFAMAEIKDQLWVLTCKETAMQKEQARSWELAALEKALDGQLLMTACWDYASIFREAKSYKTMLSVLQVA